MQTLFAFYCNNVTIVKGKRYHGLERHKKRKANAKEQAELYLLEENRKFRSTFLQRSAEGGVYQKEEERGELEEGGREKREFVKKFFPNYVRSPGGKVHLKGLPAVDSTVKRAWETQ